MSSCQAGGLAGPRGFNGISNRMSLTTVLLISSCPLVPSHAGPAAGSAPRPGPGSKVSVGAVGFAGLRAEGDERGLSYDWLCADGGP